MTDRRRAGDTRPFKRGPLDRLLWIPTYNEPFRWLPRNGEPFCVLEWVSQTIIKLLAFLPIYVAVIVTLSLLVQIFGIPFVGGR